MKRILTYTFFILLLLTACNDTDAPIDDGVVADATDAPVGPIVATDDNATDADSPSANPLDISGSNVRPVVVDQTDPNLPELCRFRSDRSVYISIQDEICFTYPNDAVLAEFNPDFSRMGVFAPPSDDPNMPVGASMILETINPMIDGIPLIDVTQNYLGQFQGEEIRTSPAGLGHAPAYLLDGVPLEFPSRSLMTIHDTGFYQLIVFPIGKGYEPVEEDLAKLWRATTLTFSFLPDAFQERFADCPTATETTAPYLNVEDGYCLLFPRYFSVATPDVANGLGATQRVITFNGPALDIDLTRGALEIMVVENMGNAPLVETVASRVTDGVQSDITIDGQPAILVEGANDSHRQAFAQSNGDLYIFTLTPNIEADDDADGVLVDVDNMWNAFIESFTFLPKDESLADPNANMESEEGTVPSEAEGETMAEDTSDFVEEAMLMTDITDVTITASDGLELVGTFYPGQGDGARPAVLLLHMLNSNRGVWADFAAQLNAAGYSALALDMRGHGATQGTRDWDLARDDMAIVWSYLTSLPNVDVNNTAVIGGSIGANMALITGVDVPLVKTVALLSPGLDYRGVATADEMVAFGDRPALIVASNDDTYAANSSQTLAENAGNSATELILYDGAGHGTAMLNANVGLAETVIEWLDEHLQ
jgi:alpha-beta hydrolase superfamily lysophospholipase